MLTTTGGGVVLKEFLKTFFYENGVAGSGDREFDKRTHLGIVGIAIEGAPSRTVAQPACTAASSWVSIVAAVAVFAVFSAIL